MTLVAVDFTEVTCGQNEKNSNYPEERLHGEVDGQKWMNGIRSKHSVTFEMVFLIDAKRKR